MTLVDIKQHLMQVKVTTLTNLCLLFKRDADTLRSMLQHWIRKGSVRLCLKTPACGSRCFKCPTAATEIYEWVGVG